MSTTDALSIIQSARTDEIVVCTMGAMNALDKMDLKPLTVACVPLMGGAASLGLGLALARPERKVIVLDGDASLLMELGGLVSIAQARPKNLYHCLVNNGVQFAGLGNLSTPGRECTDFVGLALAAGYRSGHRFADIESFTSSYGELLKSQGPVFLELMVSPEAPVLGTEHPSVEMTDARFTRMGDEIRRIRSHLGGEVLSSN